MDRIKIHMPLISLLPVGLGVASIWAFFVLYNLAGFLICPDWQPAIQAPINTTNIRTYYNDTIFIETRSGKILCAKPTITGWKDCALPSSPWDEKEAPAWLHKQFRIIPDHPVILRQVIKVTVFSKMYYFALSADDQILACSISFSENLDRIASSGIFLVLLLPIGIGLVSAAWWFKIFIQEGYPTIWDWWTGRGTPLK